MSKVEPSKRAKCNRCGMRRVLSGGLCRQCWTVTNPVMHHRRMRAKDDREALEPKRVEVSRCLDCLALRTWPTLDACGLTEQGGVYRDCRTIDRTWVVPGWCPLRTRPVLVVLADATS